MCHSPRGYVPNTKLNALPVGGLLNTFPGISLTCPWSFNQYGEETGSEKVNYWLMQQVNGKGGARTHSFWLPCVFDPLFHSVLSTVLCRAAVNSFPHLLNLKNRGKKTLLNTYMSVHVIGSF